MKTVTELEVTDYKCECPYCGAEEYGFCGDVRGQVIECDTCGEKYQIDGDADFELM